MAKRTSRKVADNDPLARLPASIRSVAEELRELVYERGELDLGGGVVIRADLNQKCTCTCAATAQIKGSATIKQGGSEDYTSNVTVTPSDTNVCQNCKNNTTRWQLVGAPQGVRITAQGDKKCTVAVANNVPKKTKFKLQATPDATCDCKDKSGAVTTKTCTGVTATSDDIEVV